MNEYEVALVSGALAIAGTLVGVIFAYRLSIKSADRQFEHLKAVAKLDAWHAAARDFIAAFADEIGTLDSDPSSPSDVADLLRGAHRRHARAIAAFQPFVNECRRSRFTEEWKEHCYGKPGSDWPEQDYPSSLDQDDLLYLHYSESAAARHKPPPRVRASTKLKAILSYAKDA